MNYYLKRRLQCGLTKNDMANELGLNYVYYSAIERGDVKMPLNLIDKFNEIINRGKENEITKTENEIKADEFWQEVSQLTENNTYVLQEKMKEFNIPSLKALVELLGYKSVSTIYNYLEGRNPVGVEFKKRLYNFFSNELNIQIPTKTINNNKGYSRKVQKSAINEELDQYYEKTDFQKIKKEYNIKNQQIAAAVGSHNSVISRMTSKSVKPSYKVIQKVKDYLDTVINDDHIVDVVVLKEEPIENNDTKRKFEYKYSKKQLKFFNTFKLLDWLKEQELKPTEFADMCNLSEGTIYNFDYWKKTNKKPTSNTINIIRKAVEEYEAKKESNPGEDPTDYISKQKLVNECLVTIEESNQKIEELTQKIKEIKAKIETSEKIIELIKSL